MSESALREQICRVGQSLFDRGYVHATAGNISARIPLESGGGFLITPTDACLGELDPARLAKLDGQLRQISGDKASKTIALHSQIYEATRSAQAAAQCVIHTHSTYCVQMSFRARSTVEYGEDELLPALTPYFVMKVGRVPIIPYNRPGSPLVAKLVGATIARYAARGQRLRAIMLERLGPNVWHQSLPHAMATLEELEETSQLMYQGLRLLDMPSLSEFQIQELREQFDASW